MIDFDLDFLKMGYFIQYRKGNDWFGKGIDARQRLAGFKPEDACFTHVEVSGGNEWSVNISPPISKLIDITKKHKGRYIRIVRYRNEEYEKKGRYKVAYFSAVLCNTKYDKFGILRFIIKWIRASNRKWFCSEGAAFALQKEFPEALNGMNKEDVMPAHFSPSEEFGLIWEGYLPK